MVVSSLMGVSYTSPNYYRIMQLLVFLTVYGNSTSSTQLLGAIFDIE
jgi:hypothetical protein